jgi:hypothetical protein
MRQRVLVIIAALVGLSACTARGQAMWDCQHEVGPAPNSGLGAFGLVGAAAQISTPEYQAWNNAVSACFDAKMSQAKQ